MIFSDQKILESIEKKQIVIIPYDQNCLGTNSYDVHLGGTLAVYEAAELDAKHHNKIRYFEIPDEGYVIQPGVLYLGVTMEYTETHNAVPFLEGKSSVDAWVLTYMRQPVRVTLDSAIPGLWRSAVCSLSEFIKACPSANSFTSL